MASRETCTVIEPTMQNDSQQTARDTEERKVARRLRIQRRLEASEQAKFAEKGDETCSILKPPIINQEEKSEELLKKLSEEGKQLVKNVQIANDSREKKRHYQGLKLSQLQREHLEAEAESAERQLKEINECWSKITSNHDVLNLHEDMQKQRGRCESLVGDKNSLIKSLEEELSCADDFYVKDLHKQAEDIALCAERIDKQVSIMKRAYKLELSLLEITIQSELEEIFKRGNENWNNLYMRHEEVVDHQVIERVDRVSKQQESTFNTHVDFSEKYRRAKIALESDIQLLQQEIGQIKATCLLNSEKLDYNFQVLKKKDEESTILKSKQKRKITKLLDVISNLKYSIEEIQQNTKVESVQLAEEVMKLHKNIMDIEEKSILFSKSNDYRYINIWEMNKSAVLELIQKVLDADRVIYEQQLSMEWTPPDMQFIYNTPLKAKEISTSPFLEEDNETPIEKSNESKKILLHQLFEKVADKSGFLLEKNIYALLKPFTKQESTLICIDTIFQALGVSSVKDIDILLEHFYPYLECPVCNDKYGGSESSLAVNLTEKNHDSQHVNGKKPDFDSQKETDSKNIQFSQTNARFENGSMLYSTRESTVITGQAELEGKKSADLSIQLAEEKRGGKKSPTCKDSKIKYEVNCCNGHPMQMNTIHILRAIREFASNVHNLWTQKELPECNGIEVLISRKINKDEVKGYWDSFLQIFPKRKEKLWDGLLSGLKKYHLTLQDRHQLLEDTSKLRNQNAELRQLLHNYINSNF